MKQSNGAVHRVLVIDDQLLVRAGMAALLDALPDFVCVGAAADAASGLLACQTLQPDLLLLDLHLPVPLATEPRRAAPAAAPTRASPPAAGTAADAGPATGLAALQGLELARVLRDEQPRLRVVVLSGRTDAEVVRAALRAGVSGFVAKDFVLEHLVQALRVVCGGHRWLSPGLAAALEASQPAPKLTPRQRDVLTHLARGQSNKAIARSLGVSVKTVEYHRSELINRLDLHDVASLTRFAIAQGLVA